MERTPIKSARAPRRSGVKGEMVRVTLSPALSEKLRKVSGEARIPEEILAAEAIRRGMEKISVF